MKGTISKVGNTWLVTSKSLKLPLHSDSTNIAQEGKKIVFKIVEVYIEPPGNIHSNRGGFEKTAKVIDFSKDPDTILKSIPSKNWIKSKICDHNFLLHKADGEIYITCSKCKQQYVSE